jgi:hypothetical protein
MAALSMQNTKDISAYLHFLVAIPSSSISLGRDPHCQTAEISGFTLHIHPNQLTASLRAVAGDDDSPSRPSPRFSKSSSMPISLSSRPITNSAGCRYHSLFAGLLCRYLEPAASDHRRTRASSWFRRRDWCRCHPAPFAAADWGASSG